MNYQLKISGVHHERVRQHLYPGDGLEAVALGLCGRHESENGIIFLVHEIFPISYEKCAVRTPDRVTWSTDSLTDILQKADARQFSVLKIHSHPGGYRQFSSTDDVADQELYQSVFGWMEQEQAHLSAVMLPSGEIFGRIITVDLNFIDLKRVSVVGNDICQWEKNSDFSVDEFALRTRQAFGEGTVNILKSMTAAVVGCSGTGSPAIEQLVRLGIGKIILIDPDTIEQKNLNRIYHSKMTDALEHRYKVAVLRDAIVAMGLGTQVIAFANNLYDEVSILKQLATVDVIFGCMDSIDGRHLLNQLATFYLIPYFDIGIKLKSDGQGGIDQIMGTVHYMQPAGSTLLSRGVYTAEELRAASLLRADIHQYLDQQKLGYIVDVVVESPAVISINTQLASMAVNEFLARIHPFRYDPNENFAITRISFTDAYLQHERESFTEYYLAKFTGRGDMLPFLNMPEF